MALTNTTLAAACGANDLTLTITSTTGFPTAGTTGNNQLVKIDGEYMYCVSVPVSGTIVVRGRGSEGTAAVAHQILAPCSTSATNSDFLFPPSGSSTLTPTYADDVVSLGADTTFTAAGTAITATTYPLPVKNTTYILEKATAQAITLITASAASIGVRMTFINAIATANTITYAPGFLGDTTSSDIATSATKVGATCVVYIGAGGLLSMPAGTATNWTVA